MGTCFSRGDQCRGRCGGQGQKVNGVGQGDMEREVSKGQDWKVGLIQAPGAMGQKEGLIHAAERSLQPFGDDNHSGTDGRGSPTRGHQGGAHCGCPGEEKMMDDHASLLLALV